jgi:hypothetical protein
MAEQSKTKTVVTAIAVVATLLLVAFLVRQMVNYTTPAPVGADRAKARSKDNADIRADGVAKLGGYGYVNPANGIVRLPIEEGMKLTIQGYQNAGEFHKDLNARVEKATVAPPPPPQKPNEYE